ncbi:MAG TPA: ATP-binding protein [Rubricoccaceae bacterium]|nr:ATP-binding protein [Rubricoccaceae bacterium]
MTPRAHRLRIPSRTSCLARVRRHVAGWADEAGLPAADAFALQLAVDEVCANTIEHAYGGRADGRMEVEATVKPDCLVVSVRHQGKPYDPKTSPAPPLAHVVAERRLHGYGLHLIQRLVDEVRFRTHNGSSEVVLTKRRAKRG